MNQLTTSGSLSLSYDGRGNLSYDGANSYGYDATNHLTNFNGSVGLGYDGLGRLAQTAGSATTNFLYDGDQVIAEYDASGNVLRRYVPTRGENEPVVWYEGSTLSDRRWLIPDERGSVIAVTDNSANVMGSGPNTYDEYGVPGSSNLGRFQYTGQMYIPEIGLYHYKARVYSPTLGRFMQTDPIGYGDGVNWYAYAHNDPINGIDPTGTVVVFDPVIKNLRFIRSIF